jgi:hypothetical protein
MLFRGQPYPSTAQQHADHQKQQWQQINQTYATQYHAFSDRDDHLVSRTCIDWIHDPKFTGLAAKQSGQFTRPATAVFAPFTTIGVMGLNMSKPAFDLQNDSASFQHIYLPL